MRLHDISKSNSTDRSNILSAKELKDLQKVLLLMLVDIKKICIKNNLKFVLIGGSGIGAMRHHGFIPWDDDVDIAMSRKDYNEFLSIIRHDYSEKYTISDSRDKQNYGKIIPKLRLNNTKYIDILDDETENPGIRIDIFIIENTYDNAILRNIHGFGCMFYGFALSCRRIFNFKNKTLIKSFSFKMKSFIGFLFSFASVETWARWTDKCNSFCTNNKSKYVSVPSDGPHFFKGITERQNLCNTKTVLFENEKLWVPYDVDNYLRKIYGDYMVIPPVEKQLTGKYKEYDLGEYKQLL